VGARRLAAHRIAGPPPLQSSPSPRTRLDDGAAAVEHRASSARRPRRERERQPADGGATEQLRVRSAQLDDATPRQQLKPHALGHRVRGVAVPRPTGRCALKGGRSGAARSSARHAASGAGPRAPARAPGGSVHGAFQPLSIRCRKRRDWRAGRSGSRERRNPSGCKGRFAVFITIVATSAPTTRVRVFVLRALCSRRRSCSVGRLFRCTKRRARHRGVRAWSAERPNALHSTAPCIAPRRFFQAGGRPAAWAASGTAS
jgi:hypothetical protein